MKIKVKIRNIGIAVLAISPLVCIAGGNGKFELGARFDGNLGNGTPANDILGGAITARYRINDDWLIGGAAEFASFDFERPYKELGLDSTEEVDSTVDSTMLSIWAERRYGEHERGGYWYWTAGLGVNDLDADDIEGMTTDGGSYYITTDIDTEIAITLTAGWRHNISDHWTLGYGIRLEQRFGDWVSEDRISGEKGTATDGYFVYGLALEATYRF
jgi:opacity protein-like surface antigen